MKQWIIHFIYFLMFSLSFGCGPSSDSGQSMEYNYPPPPEDVKIPPSKPRTGGGVVVGEQKPIEPEIKEYRYRRTSPSPADRPNAGKSGICSPDAEARMRTLMNIHQRRNGKVKRGKVARTLNREGFRRWNGKKFRRRHVPKYAY
jgi:hypothetical protein